LRVLVRPLLALLAVLALLGLGACGNDAEEAPPPSPPAEEVIPAPPEDAEPPPTPQDEEPPEAAVRECTNEPDAYTVEYPQDWEINAGDTEPPCSYFDPDPIDLPEAQEAPLDIAVSIRREPANLDRVSGEDPTIEVLERETTEVDGRDAIHRLTESTGGGLRPEGIRAYQYLVDLAGETLIASTYDVDGEDFDANREVLDAMMESLRWEE
jgi:hypothetical protein